MSFYPAYNHEIEKLRKERRTRRSVNAVAEEGKKVSELAGGYNFFPDMIDHHYADYVSKVGQGVSIPKSMRKTVIVGGGIAGLIAGIELIRAGINVKIYDGGDRLQPPSKKDSNVGGRFCTSTISSLDKKFRFSAEMGAMRFPVGSKVFWNYFRYALTTLKKLPPGITDRDPTLYPFPNSGVVPTAILFKGTLYTYEFGTKDLPDKFKRVRDKVGSFINSISLSYPIDGDKITLQEVAEWCKTDISGNESVKEKIQWFWSQMIAQYDRLSFGEVIRGIGLTSEEVEIFYYLGFGTGGFGPLYPISFLEIIRLSIWDFAVEYALPITSTQFAEMLKDLLYAEKCNDAKPSWGRVEWNNATVVGVGRSPKAKFFYAVRDPDTPTSIQVRSDARTVIVATSHRAYTKSLNLDAPYKAFVGEELNLDTGVFSWKNNKTISLYHRTFLDTTVASMKNLHTLSSLKFFCVLKKPWVDNYWPKVADKPARVILSDTLSMQMYWLDQNPESQDILCLATYLWGDECRKNQADTYYTTKQIGAQGRIAVCRVLAASLEAYNRAQDADNPNKDIKFDTLFRAFLAINDEQQLDNIVWEDEPLINTAFKLAYPGEIGNTMSLVYQFQMATDDYFRANDYANLFLAGESCSFYGGWAEGAMISGINVASGALMSVTNNTKAQTPAFAVVNTLSRYDNYDGSKENIVVAFQTESAYLALAILIGGRNTKIINIVTRKNQEQHVRQVSMRTVYSDSDLILIITYCSDNKLWYGELNLHTFNWHVPLGILSDMAGEDGYVTLEYHYDKHTTTTSNFIFYQGSNKSLRRYDLEHKKDIVIEKEIIESYIHSVHGIPYFDQKYHYFHSTTLLFSVSNAKELTGIEVIDNTGRGSRAVPVFKNVIRNSGAPALFSHWISSEETIVYALFVMEGDMGYFNIMGSQIKYSNVAPPPAPITFLIKKIKKTSSSPNIYIFAKKINGFIYLFYKQQNDLMRVLVFDEFSKFETPSINFRADRPYIFFPASLTGKSGRVLDIMPFS